MPSLTKVQSGFMEAQGALPLSPGTAAAPGLKFSDHAGTGMFSPSTGAIGFSTSSHQQALTLDTAGRLGLGASNNTAYDSNAQNLLLASDGNTGMTIRSAGSTPFAMIHFADGTSGQAQQRAGRIMYQHDGDNLTFHTANTERLRINGNGKVGVGVIPNSNWHTSDVSTVLQVENSHIFDFNAAQLDLGHNYYYDGNDYKFSTTGYASRLTFSKSNGAMRLWSLGTGNANATCTLSERFHVTASGQILAGGADTTLAHANADDVIIGNTSSGKRTGITLVSAADQDAGLYFSDGTSTNNANIQGQIVYNHNDTTLKFYTGASSAITIKSGGHTDFTGYADFIRPANDAYSYAGFGPGGTSAKAAFIRRGSEIDLELWSNYSGSPTVSINSNGSIFGSSINLQSSATSSWFQTGTSVGASNYVWAAKDSSSNTWHSGLQTDGDLYLGGNLAGSNNIGLNGSSGSAFFANQALWINSSGTITVAHPTTSAKIQMAGDISGNYTGWKERNVASGSMSSTSIASKTPTINDFTYPNSSNGMLIWSTSKIGFAAGSESPQYGNGVQMLYDGNGLILGGLRAFDRTTSSSTATNFNIRLRSSGIAEFKSQVYANPLMLTNSGGWIKSGYGAISNGTVSSLNNLLIGQNMRGYIESIDGGSTNNNFYSLSTYGAGGMGHAGTEYCYNGTTKFYNDGNASTANTTFNPVTSMQINSQAQITTPHQPAFQVSRNQSNWSVSGLSKFDWDLVEHNRGGHFSTSTDRFTAPVYGIYQFNFSIIFYASGLSNEWISHRRNGSRFTGGDMHFSIEYSANRWHHVSYSMSCYMNANDYMEVYNGGSTTINYHGMTWGQWSGYLVG